MLEKPKLLSFKAPAPGPRQDVVDALEGILKRAQGGEIDAVYVAALCPNGDAVTAFSATDDMFRAVGVIEWLKNRVMQEV